MMGYQPQPSLEVLLGPSETQKQGKPTSTPKSCVQVLNKLSILDSALPSTDSKVVKAENKVDKSTVKSEMSQQEAQHTKAVLRKEMKKDHYLNTIFEEIWLDFYLLEITQDLFIEISIDFKLMIR